MELTTQALKCLVWVKNILEKYKQFAIFYIYFQRVGWWLLLWIFLLNRHVHILFKAIKLLWQIILVSREFKKILYWWLKNTKTLTLANLVLFFFFVFGVETLYNQGLITFWRPIIYLYLFCFELKYFIWKWMFTLY